MIDTESPAGAWADHIAATGSYPQLRTAHDIIEESEDADIALHAALTQDASGRIFEDDFCERGDRLHEERRDKALDRIAALEAELDARRIAARDADRELDRLRARVAELEAALVWYGEQARLARIIHSEGDAGRQSLAADGGQRARAALGREK